jgi:hypothetical protein
LEKAEKEDEKKKTVMADVSKMEYVWPANLFYVGRYSTAIIHIAVCVAIRGYDSDIA